MRFSDLVWMMKNATSFCNRRVFGSCTVHWLFIFFAVYRGSPPQMRYFFQLIRRQRRLFILTFLGIVILIGYQFARSEQQKRTQNLRVQFDASIHKEPFTGRVYIFFSKRRKEPRTGPDWFHPEMFIARDVSDWKPGESLEFSVAKQSEFLAFPRPFSEMNLAGYRAQAVVRFNPHERLVGTGAGNGFSNTISIPNGLISQKQKPLLLEVNQIVKQRKLQETQWLKQVQFRSELLSKFHQRDVIVQGSVLLPASYYSHPKRHYPTIYQIPGFGGTHIRYGGIRPVKESNKQGVEYIRVILDPSSPRGHHVFADSENNGPVGTSLIEEFIPKFDQQFRSIPKPTARFLTGHSSGGWSSLWVMINYPDHFGGTWSTAPDPVDFSDFQQINIYCVGANMYVDSDKKERPIARRNGKVLLWYRGFDQMEHVLGYGGQLHSFEASFSPRGKDGNPVPAWNRKTGKIDTSVTKNWKKYDIKKILTSHWKQLAPQLNGKIHLYMGEEDTFYLEGATRNLKESMDKISADIHIELFPGKNHSSLMDRKMRDRIRKEMTESFLKHHSDWK